MSLVPRATNALWPTARCKWTATSAELAVSRCGSFHDFLGLMIRAYEIPFPYHPWSWYIYLHGWLILMVNCREIYHTWMPLGLVSLNFLPYTLISRGTLGGGYCRLTSHDDVG